MARHSNGPKTEIKDDVLLIYFRLVKLGFGTLEQVKQLDSREVLQALFYEKFLSDYEEAYLELNK